MIDISCQDHGIIEDCIDDDWLDIFCKQFQTQENLTEREHPEWNSQIGSTNHDLLSTMFVKKIERIRGFGIPIIMSLKFRNRNVGPHCDFPLITPFGVPNKTFLVPLNNFTHSSTVIFNEYSRNIIGYSAGQQIIDQLPKLPDNRNCCESNNLGHVPIEVKQRLSVKKILLWQKNSILFWNSDLLHCGCAFDQTRFGSSRNALIIWTKQLIHNH